jgi:hypothetical protein
VNQVKVSIRPALFTAPSGQRYAVAGSQWVPVPSDTTQANIDQFVIYSPPEAQQDDNNGSWQVTGSKGNTYTVRTRDGQWFCSCAGFSFRRKCRHIEETRNESR